MRSKTLLLVCLLIPSVARAFDDPSQFFDRAPNQPHAATLGASAEGIYFTGAPRFVSQTCESCHTDGPKLVHLKLGADDQSLFSSGYRSGATYEIQVSLESESKGLTYGTPTCTEPTVQGDKYTYVQCNNNAFALEIDASYGPLTGASIFCAAAPENGVCPPVNPNTDEALIGPNGDAVFANRPHSTDPAQPKLVTRNDPTSWHFWWTAPTAGTGPVTVYVAAVDGNGGAGVSVNDQDPYGDDTISGSFFIQEQGGVVSNSAEAACSMAGHGSELGAMAMGVVLLAFRFRSRRQRMLGARRDADRS